MNGIMKWKTIFVLYIRPMFEFEIQNENVNKGKCVCIL